MSAPKRCSLQTVAFADVAAALPSKKPFDHDDMALVDLLILAKGFEDRVLAVPRCLSERGWMHPQSHVLVGQYRTNVPDNEERYTQLLPVLQRHSERIELFDAESPIESHRAVNAEVSLLQEKRGSRRLHVAVDMSGASSTLIFSLIATLFRHPSNVKVTVLYAEAGSYFPQVEKPTQIELTPSNLTREEGTDGIQRHELFRGHETPSRSKFIIGVPSYSFGRFEQCIYELGEEGAPSPQDVLALIMPHTTAANHQHHKDNIAARIESIFTEGAMTDAERASPQIVPCDVQEYAHTVRTIIEIADERLGSNVYLVHFGPKLQTLGAALALLARSEVCLIFARPKKFNAGAYSEGIGKIWRIDFDDPAEVLTALRQVGNIHVRQDEVRPSEAH